MSAVWNADLDTVSTYVPATSPGGSAATRVWDAGSYDKTVSGAPARVTVGADAPRLFPVIVSSVSAASGSALVMAMWPCASAGVATSSDMQRGTHEWRRMGISFLLSPGEYENERRPVPATGLKKT